MDARALAWACVLVLGAAGAAKTPKEPLPYLNNSQCEQCEPCQACQPCASCVQRPCPAPAPAPPPPPCRTPWALVAKYRSHPGIGVYRLHTQRATWTEAQKICEADGTHLAVINSQGISSKLNASQQVLREPVAVRFDGVPGAAESRADGRRLRVRVPRRAPLSLTASPPAAESSARFRYLLVLPWR
ncbi:mRNA, clone: 2, partial [Gryllus bimaculatus]